MAWNKPSESGEAISRSLHKKSSLKRSGDRFSVKGAVTGAIIVLGAVIAWRLLREDDSIAKDIKHTPPRTIREVKPAPTSKTIEQAGVKPDPNARPTEPGIRLNGYVMLPNGKLHKIRGPATNTTGLVKSPYAIFKYPCENILAEILTVEPGESMVGTPSYNGRFVENFLKSIKEPIIVVHDDPEDIKELKRALNEAKIELKAAYDRGEDIEEIVLKSREEAQELARYKQELRKEVLRYANREATTAEDAEDFLGAANAMLEAKGIAPLDDTPLTRIKLKMKEKWETEKK